MKVDYNNIGIGVIAIGSVLNIIKELTIAKATLVLPFVTHNESLSHLSRVNTSVQSIEKLIAEKTSYFSNFNLRYYDSLCLTISSIQYLTDMGYAKFIDDRLVMIKALEYNKEMGTRADKIFKAANNISVLLAQKDTNLFLNLRIEL